MPNVSLTPAQNFPQIKKSNQKCARSGQHNTIIKRDKIWGRVTRSLRLNMCHIKNVFESHYDKGASSSGLRNFDWIRLMMRRQNPATQWHAMMSVYIGKLAGMISNHHSIQNIICALLLLMMLYIDHNNNDDDNNVLPFVKQTTCVWVVISGRLERFTIDEYKIIFRLINWR